MPYTRCPHCRKVQQVAPPLVGKEVGCMGNHCGKRFAAESYRLHSGPLSRLTFWFVIAFAIFLCGRWIWLNSSWIVRQLG